MLDQVEEGGLPSKISESAQKIKISNEEHVQKLVSPDLKKQKQKKLRRDYAEFIKPQTEDQIIVLPNSW